MTEKSTCERNGDPAPLDIIGSRVGRLLIKGYAGKMGIHHRYKTLCDCGNEKEVSRQHLISANPITSCGCLRKERAKEATYKDITGKRFGRLVAVMPLEGVPSHSGTVWKCKCDCSNETEVSIGRLNGGQTKSCGCLQRERTSQASSTHKMIGTLEHNSWRGMYARTTNPNNNRHEQYSRHNVVVAEEWRDFARFFSDMGYRIAGTSLDRVDPTRGYNVDNCMWATVTQQAENKCGGVNSFVMLADKRFVYLADIIKAGFDGGEVIGYWSSPGDIDFDTFVKRYRILNPELAAGEIDKMVEVVKGKSLHIDEVKTIRLTDYLAMLAKRGADIYPTKTDMGKLTPTTLPKLATYRGKPRQF